jgi:hypothetical protein
MRILLVNPPIYDFSAYDFWLKPFGLLSVGGMLRGHAEVVLFDFLDRLHPKAGERAGDEWGRGRFRSHPVDKPEPLKDIRRIYKRFGLPLEEFFQVLDKEGPFDWALIATSMTYWYPGVREILEVLRRSSPGTRLALGGPYCSICPDHALSLGADLVVGGRSLGPLWEYLGWEPSGHLPPFWEGYPRLETGVIKLSDGCPFRCTYCSVPNTDPVFKVRNLNRSLDDLLFLVQQGVQNVAFYDDALLFKPETALIPFLEEVIRQQIKVSFHTPNALNARFVTPRLAELMVQSGFQNFYLGFESSETGWQKQTGGKVFPFELERAVSCFDRSGFPRKGLCCYLIAGHPLDSDQNLEASLRLAHGLGLRTMLSEFSPIPGTPDGEICRRHTDLDEPLNHNKLAFTHRWIGQSQLQEFKDLCADLNRSIQDSDSRVITEGNS